MRHASTLLTSRRVILPAMCAALVLFVGTPRGVLGADAPAPAPAATTPPPAPDLTAPDGVLAQLNDSRFARSISADEYTQMLKVVEAASAAAPSDGKWHTARAAIEGRLGNKERAVELAQQGAKAAPNDPRSHYWLGNALFENIENVGMFSKMGVATDGEKAYLKAIELDPDFIEPRFAIIQFYMNAPSIAGGSLKKARQQAQAIIEVGKTRGAEQPHGARAISSGHSMLAMIAGKDEDWDEAAKQHRLASQAAMEPKDKFNALTGLGLMLVRDRKDAHGALKIADEARALGVADDSTADFITGLARQQLGEWEPAVAAYREVIRKNPAAMNSRFGLAECLEKTGDKAGAAAMYEEFAAKFPNDKRAEDAAARAKKLRKSLK